MKFFRPLRKNTNTNINYIKYAVGEVVLVVIGILIALQVNNFNETRLAFEGLYFDIRIRHNKYVRIRFW
ncbi:hypothetical protein N8451_03850 [Polaribacter sp.]|nr:hypothetical protein [Polaribacter sp.]